MNGVLSGHKTRLPTFPRQVTFRKCQGGGQLRNPNVCSKNTPFNLGHCGKDCRYETSWALVSGNWAPCGPLLRTEKKEEERRKRSWRSCMRSKTEGAGPAWYPSASSRTGNTLESQGTFWERPGSWSWQVSTDAAFLTSSPGAIHPSDLPLLSTLLRHCNTGQLSRRVESDFKVKIKNKCSKYKNTNQA